MPKKLISAMLMLALLCSSLAIPQDFHLTASAETSYTYIDRTWNDSTKTMTKTNPSISSYTTVATSDTTWTEDNKGGWYVVTGNTTIYDTVTVTGDVKLILCDGTKLTSNAGITVESGATLTIYAQSEGKSMGELVVNGADGTNATGGSAAVSGSGTVTIDGGNVSATGGNGGDGGDGGKGGDGGDSFSNQVTINGGEVTATGGNGGDGFGGGDGGDSFSNQVTINGGEVTATGGNGGDGGKGGDGGGDGGKGFGGTVIISGGNVSATGGKGGNGDRGDGGKGFGGKVTINGGNVSATGGDGGFGGGDGANGGKGFGGTVIISGGNVSATGGKGKGYGGGGDGFGGYGGYGDGGKVTINGGNVSATGGYGGSEVRNAGANGFCGTVTINGGNVSANGGKGGDGGDGKAFSQTPKNSNETELSLKTYTLDGVTSQTKVHSVEGVSNYGLNDVHTLTDNDNHQKLYFYLPEGENVTRMETATGQPFKAQSVTGGDNTLYAVLFRAQTTLGYILSEKTSADKGNGTQKIELPKLGVLSNASEGNITTTNKITDSSQLAWYSGNTKISNSSVSIGDEYKLVTAKYKVNGTSVGDAPDKYQIVEVVDNETLYVGVFQTTDTEGVTNHEIKVGIKANGENFYRWVGNVDKDEDLEVLSYNKTYYFFARSDRTIIAEYKDSGTVETAACTNIESVEKVEEGGTTYFKVVSMSSVPKGYTIIYAGLLAYNDNGQPKNFKAENCTGDATISYYYIRGYDSEKNNAQYTWTKKIDSSKKTWYVRAYLNYKDENEEQHDELGEIFKIELNANNEIEWTSVPEATEGGQTE